MSDDRSMGSILSRAILTLAFLLIIATIILITLFHVSTYKITGHSMNPTLFEGDLVVAAQKNEYRRGEVIAFEMDDIIYIKRIIGIPGDKVFIDDDGTVYVNDKEIKEKYISQKAKGLVETSNPYTVAPSEYYVLGDNRGDSKDSRLLKVGAIREDKILGKVYFSLNKFKLI